MEPMNQSTRKKVLCPVTSKEGKTFWVRMGSAYINKDNSINLYLDGLPVNGRLQIRDDIPWEKKGDTMDSDARRSNNQDELPF